MSRICVVITNFHRMYSNNNSFLNKRYVKVFKGGHVLFSDLLVLCLIFSSVQRKNHKERLSETLMVLLKFLWFLFFRYLMILSFLSSTEYLPIFNVGSSISLLLFWFSVSYTNKHVKEQY